MLFLIVTIMFSALCVIFDCYDCDSRLVLFLVDIMLIIALCVVFDWYHDDLRAPFCFSCYHGDYHEDGYIPSHGPVS